MKKQYCMEWFTKSGRDGFKDLGYDLTEKECRSALNRKMKQRSTASASITWNYVGNDVPDEELGEEYFFLGATKTHLEILGSTFWIDNEITETKGE